MVIGLQMIMTLFEQHPSISIECWAIWHLSYVEQLLIRLTLYHIYFLCHSRIHQIFVHAVAILVS